MKKLGLMLIGTLIVSGTLQAAPKQRKVVRSTAHQKNVVKVSQVKERTDRSKLEKWIAEMKKRISRSHAKQNQLVAVAAVRGDDTSDAPPLYWKGKMAKGPVEMPELQEFEQAIDATLGDDPAAGRQKLEAFIANHPQSTLLADAKETLTKLDEVTPTP